MRAQFLLCRSCCSGISVSQIAKPRLRISLLSISIIYDDVLMPWERGWVFDVFFLFVLETRSGWRPRKEVDRWLEGEHYHLEGDFTRPTFSGVVFGVDFEFGC